jgi:hypothetical protein
MGVVGNGYSEAAERALADFGSEKSFGRAAQQFQEHYGWEIDRGTVLRRTEAVAKDSEQYLQERLTGAVGVYQPLPPEAPEETTFVVELDGCEIRMGAFMTAKEAGKTDRDPDERVRDVQWQEVRTGVVRPLEETDKFYVCAKATYPQVCDQLFGMACARGLNSSSVVIAPGDGGNGLREEMEVHFDTIQYILDPGHLKSHFYETANELGIDKKLQQAWVNTHMERLWNNEVETVIANLKDLYQQTKNDRVRRLINHLIRFADAVDYGCFKEKDWPVGSGEVESAHRYVPQERLKIAGACWHPKTVNPMLALRVVRANGWWDTFWQWLHVQRAQQRAA